MNFKLFELKTGKIRCVQSFAKRKQLKNMDFTLFELKIGKRDTFNLLQSENSQKTWIRSHFLCGQRVVRKASPPHKKFLASSNGLEITLECLICVQQGLFLSWDQYLVYFEPLGSLQTQRKNFLTKCQKSPPPSKTKKISPKNVYVISLGCLKNVQRCLFLL